MGSDHLEAVLRARREELKCDVAVISDTNMVGPDQPTLTYGLRGIAALEVDGTRATHNHGRQGNNLLGFG